MSPELLQAAISDSSGDYHYHSVQREKDWISCWKKSIRSSSLDWQELKIVENRRQSSFSVFALNHPRLVLALAERNLSCSSWLVTKINSQQYFTRSFLFCLSNWVVQTHQQYFTRSFLFCLSNWVVQTHQQYFTKSFLFCLSNWVVQTHQQYFTILKVYATMLFRLIKI